MHNTFHMLGRMKHLTLSILLFLASWLPTYAMDWESLRFKCALVFPEGEGWVQGPVEKNRDGEVILSLSNPIQKSAVWLYVTAQVGITNLKHPAIPARVAGVLAGKGYPNASEPKIINKNGVELLQIVGTGTTNDGASKVGVIRVGIKDSRMYYLLTTGEGEKDRAEEGMLMRVADTFRFVESAMNATAPNFLKKHYFTAAIICMSMAVVMLIGYWTVLYITRYRKTV